MKPAERMKIPREPMPALDPVARSSTFNEVNLGLAEQHASRALYPGAVLSLEDPRSGMIFYVERDGRQLVALRRDG